MTTYKIFKRSGTYDTGWGRRMTVDTGLTVEQAQHRCAKYNSNRTARQRRRGTKMEFIKED